MDFRVSSWAGSVGCGPFPPSAEDLMTGAASLSTNADSFFFLPRAFLSFLFFKDPLATAARPSLVGVLFPAIQGGVGARAREGEVGAGCVALEVGTGEVGAGGAGVGTEVGGAVEAALLEVGAGRVGAGGAGVSMEVGGAVEGALLGRFGTRGVGVRVQAGGAEVGMEAGGGAAEGALSGRGGRAGMEGPAGL